MGLRYWAPSWGGAPYSIHTTYLSREEHSPPRKLSASQTQTFLSPALSPLTSSSFHALKIPSPYCICTIIKLPIESHSGTKREVTLISPQKYLQSALYTDFYFCFCSVQMSTKVCHMCTCVCPIMDLWFCSYIILFLKKIKYVKNAL